MKALIYFSIFVFSGLGSWLGAALDHGNWFGALSILLGAVGAFVGIWIALVVNKNYF